jgi:uncharacterized damage-inducible protein DinB
MISEITEAWHVNNRINLFLIDNISNEGWLSTLSSPGGRDVARQFAHLHNVRVMWLETRPAAFRKTLPPLKKFESTYSPSKHEVKEALSISADAMEKLFEAAVTEGTMPGYKRGVLTLFGYFITHDAHHRGNILLTLKQTGNKVSQEVQYAIWEWEKI